MWLNLGLAEIDLMAICDWFKSGLEYSCDVVNSGFQGARSAGETALAGDSVRSVLSRSARSSWPSAAVGIGLGALGGLLLNKRRQAIRSVALGLLGGSVGFVAGMAWGTREFTGDVARGARRGMNAARDAHWLERNPIDYA